MPNNVKRSGGYRLTVGCVLLAVCLIILLPMAISAMDNGTASTALFIAAGIAAIVGIFLMMNGSLVRRRAGPTAPLRPPPPLGGSPCQSHGR